MINFLLTNNLPIKKQLEIEEALLKSNNDNWCIVNLGSPLSIVLGSFNKIEEHVDLSAKAPIIKRFSGGGTVVVDENTIFVSFIFSKKKLAFSFPEEIFRWTETFYKKIFPKAFCLKENDYTIENKKCGGNAQYLKKERWLHHTSFLWGFEKKNMELLKLPKKAPNYRNARSHENFLSTISEYFDCKEHFASLVKKTLKEEFQVRDVSLADALLLAKKDQTK